MKIYGQSDRGNIRASDIEREVGFDKDTTQRALRFLHRQPYFEEQGALRGGDEIIFVGPPTGEALRVAGAWPSPEGLVERLIAAFEAASEDANREEPERRRFKESAEFMGSGSPASPVALQAFGGGGRKIIS